jgi:dsRNA-specific ribonuclease
MKSLRVAERAVGQLLAGKGARPCCLRVQRQQALARCISTSRSMSNAAAATEEVIFEDETDLFARQDQPETAYPSPPPEAALSSAKLAALHARLKLPEKLPLQTLARTLVDSSADPSRDFNNSSLAQVGSSLLSFHVSEWLLCTYPRLPMAVLFSAMNAYIGPATLTRLAQEWGVESAAVPGAEVDPGLLQFSKMKPGAVLPVATSVRPNNEWNYRRGMSSRIVYDDEFGDVLARNAAQETQTTEAAHAHFVRALIGSIYLHSGRAEAKAFIRAHILSRHLPIDKLFVFETATRDLSRLCAREDFEFPVARLLSETGRHSRHPVYVVGIYSGKDKLGEAAGASLDEARMRAAIAALKSWYMYSPVPGQGTNVRVPSDVEQGGKWDGVHIDMGEIVAC